MRPGRSSPAAGIDPPGGEDALQVTPLAHAELNALAAIPTDRQVGDCILWSTQQPCAMCAAAITFTGVGGVRFLALDPAFIATTQPASVPYQGPSDDRWVVTANLLLLHNVARAHGGEGRILAANRDIEPETLGLALDVVSEGILTHLTFQDRRLPTALAILWDRIDDGAARRRRRLDRQ